MKTLHEFGIDSDKLLIIVRELNALKFAPPINTVGHEFTILKEFVLVIDRLKKYKVRRLPYEIKQFYNSLPDELFHSIRINEKIRVVPGWGAIKVSKTYR